MKLIIYISLLLFSNILLSQKEALRKELKLVKQANNTLSGVSMDVDYYMYKDHDSKRVYEHHKGNYSKKENMFSNFIYGSLTVQNADYLMVKDDSAKVIMLGNTTASNYSSGTIDVEAVLRYCKEINHIASNKEGQKAFQLVFNSKSEIEFTKIDVYINGTTHLLDEMVLYYSNPVDYSKDPKHPDFHLSKMQIVYSNVKIAARLSNRNFSLVKYVDFTQSEVTLQPAYKTYELVLAPNFKL